MSLVLRRPLEDNYSPGPNPSLFPPFIPATLDSAVGPGLSGNRDIELNAPSVRALKIFDIAQVTTTKTLQFRHAVLGPG